MSKLNDSLTPLMAIKRYCFNCNGDCHPRNCADVNCQLYPFRLGKNSLQPKKPMSDARKEQLLKNLQKRWSK